MMSDIICQQNKNVVCIYNTTNICFYKKEYDVEGLLSTKHTSYLPEELMRFE